MLVSPVFHSPGETFKSPSMSHVLMELWGWALEGEGVVSGICIDMCFAYQVLACSVNLELFSLLLLVD